MIAFLSWGHYKYTQGEEACQLAQATAKADYWEQRSTRLAEESKQALKQEKLVSDAINKTRNNRQVEVEKSIALDKANPNGSCVYSSDELLDVNESIRQANGT